MKKYFLLILFGFLSLSAKEAPKQKLILFISVDQMRADYLERYSQYYTGGLKRLREQSKNFVNADLNYATSETGPGHATLGTGSYPHRSGIVSNDWIDRETMKSMYCVADSTAEKVDGIGGGFSAKNLLVDGLGDWLKKASPKSKVIGISNKDRAAILMSGKHPDFAFWYDGKNDAMVTSAYYTKSLPKWVKDFNAQDWAEKNVPDAWIKILPEKEYDKIGPDNFFAERQTDGSSSFPHPFTKGKKGTEITGTPWGDKLLTDFALEAITHEKLSKRGVVDLLCVSFSSCDYVGHGYGPDSHEMMDYLIQLDRTLGKFFNDIENLVGKDGYIVALSADHAGCPLPEFNSQMNGVDAVRFSYKELIKPAFDSLAKKLKKELHSDEEILTRNGYINYAKASALGFDSSAIEAKIRYGILSWKIYPEIYFRREMESQSPTEKLFMQKYRNSYLASRCKDFQLRIKENSIVSSNSTGTTHGSPYLYDTHIPVVFWWNSVKPEKILDEAHSADIAPTIARFFGFSFPKEIDGKVLTEIFQ
ncbi:MAG: alkaline phosphatase family protein [Bacteroidetes bacterium]|nr:alkaline phosphatase family protein [Bacteroidota bacterium]